MAARERRNQAAVYTSLLLHQTWPLDDNATDLTFSCLRSMYHSFFRLRSIVCPTLSAAPTMMTSTES